jgi:glycosyltransferase involved in cell wall biosynthesis
MLIGLDGIPLTLPKTGVGHYTAQIARALALTAPQYEFRLVYPSRFSANSFQADSTAPANLSALRVPVGPVAKHWWSVGLPRYLLTKKLQLFHGTNYDIPLWRRCPTVLTIHDLSVLLHPETHEKRTVRRARRRLPLMAKTADAIIVPTDAIRREVCEHLAVREQKVFVVPEAAREFFEPVDFAATVAVRKKFGIGDEFVLTVGTLEPRKNIPRIVSAFEELPVDGNLQLVIAGGQGWLSSPSVRAIENSSARNRIVLTDYLHDDDLRALYSSCRVFVYPSLYEGFGLPPIEAMACGAPVVVSNIPALVESTGGAAKVADAHDANDLARVILQLLTDPHERQRLVEAGRQRTAELTWEDAASKTLAVYETVL